MADSLAGAPATGWRVRPWWSDGLPVASWRLARVIATSSQLARHPRPNASVRVERNPRLWRTTRLTTRQHALRPINPTTDSCHPQGPVQPVHSSCSILRRCPSGRTSHNPFRIHDKPFLLLPSLVPRIGVRDHQPNHGAAGTGLLGVKVLFEALLVGSRTQACPGDSAPRPVPTRAAVPAAVRPLRR
jgi:hypothetical protein